MRFSRSICCIFSYYYSSKTESSSLLLRWLSDKLVAYSVMRDVDGQKRVIALVSGGWHQIGMSLGGWSHVD